MNELKSIALAAEKLRHDAEPFLVATVVRVSGSSYRRPGARMLVTRDLWVGGSVSGGCIEQDVLRKGWWWTSNGAPRLVTYDAHSDGALGWGLGPGCNGTVDVLLEPGKKDGLDPMEFIARCYKTQERGAIATVFGGATPLGTHVAVTSSGSVASDGVDEATRERIAEECRRVLDRAESKVVGCRTSAGPVDALIEAVLPPPRFFVIGGGHDAVPVVSIASTVGWETIVCDASARFAMRERFPAADEIVAANPAEIAARVDACDRAMAVVMAHDYERDRACLAALLETRVAYIGMLGPRNRTARMLDELGASRHDPRVHAPVGLALGAETPQEIALSIVAEAQSVLTGMSGASLREQSGSIHAATFRASAGG
jgi:xanthine/CO dehydrogenase XdhC/CoxF family maturation factor